MKRSFKIDQPAHNLTAGITGEIPRLRRYALTLTRAQIDIDDLVQECIVRALSKAHLWQEGTNLRAWLFAIMRNTHIDEMRRVKREGLSVQVRESEPLLGHPAEQSKRLELRDLCRALSRLPDAQRIAVLLTGLDGMSQKAMAAIAGVPVGTIRARISRGRAALRRLTEVTDTALGPSDLVFLADTSPRCVSDADVSRPSLRRSKGEPGFPRPPRFQAILNGFNGVHARCSPSGRHARR